MSKMYSCVRALRFPAPAGVAAMALITLALPARATTSFANGSFQSVGSASASFSIDYAPDAPNNVLADWTATPSGNQILDCLVFAGATTNLCGTHAFGGGFSFWVNPGPSPDGGNYVAIDGDEGYSTPLVQSISGLVIGQEYAVSFYQAAAQQNGFTGPTTEQWEVELGSQSEFSTLMTDLSHEDVGWMSQTLTFTATAATEALSFIAVGTPNGLPPFVLLDGVSFTAVPEPATVALLGIGLIGVSIAGRFFKKR